MVMTMTRESAADVSYEWDGTQKIAIDRCVDMRQRIVPITGAAGTGKTTIIREVYIILREAGYRVGLAAPTGKAAKRIHEATGLPAMTLHRMLEYPHPGERDPDTGAALVSTDPRRDRGNPLEYDVVLVDEYAMVSHELHRNLIHSLPRNGRVCMFGDVNQLKPIEHGPLALKPSPFINVLEKFKGTRLTTIHRTDEGSDVAFNGARIIKGQMPLRKPDFQIKVTEYPVDALTDIVMTALEEHNINYGTNQGQIISYTKRSWIGTRKLNAALQDLLNPLKPAERRTVARHPWDNRDPIRVGPGDKVICTENCYDLRNEWDRYVDGDPENGYIATPPDKTIMNGETGVVMEIGEDDEMLIDVGDRIVSIPRRQAIIDKRNKLITIDPQRSLDLGFCITTHKAQGSEWPYIIYVMNSTTRGMQTRHNFYTAISRARTAVHVISDQKSLLNSVQQTMTVQDRIASTKR